MGSSSCCKYLMFFFNMLIFLGGAAIVGIATWITVNADSFMKIVSVDDTAIFNSTYFLFISGGLLLVIGFLGCCGAMKENQCLLGMFFTFVLIAVIIEVAGAVFFAMNTEVAENAIKETMKDYGVDGQEVLTEAWNLAQAELNCCGWDGATDWASALKAPPCTLSGLMQGGCKSVLVSYFVIVAGVALGILLIELLAMIFSCCIFCRVSKGQDSY